MRKLGERATSEKKRSIGRRRVTVRACGLTDRGLVRAENQDAYHIDPERSLFMVCDGMGGAQGGAVAAQAAVALLPRMIEGRLALLKRWTAKTVAEALTDSIAEMSKTLYERTRDNPDLRGMGTTVVLAQVAGKHIYIAHIGDSRAYLAERTKSKAKSQIAKAKTENSEEEGIAEQDSTLMQLTRDHSIVAVMLELGQITPEQAKVHPMRSRITRCAGMEGKAVADVRKVSISPGSRLLLCSDGLSSYVPEPEISRVLAEVQDCEQACRELIVLANKAGGYDNATVVIVDF